ncbi:DUF5106 domain-containing protein [uncultured Alistipes sp.]|jgi:hypothetical protein|uniref:DUF5106 domain-containing protein n=1 Tax=uncultured Alistipes sp. TaxID=538949 RepID=UPI002637850B|nr:DUF5106 domain-containing protein [uncultured Alistipes sp.]
MKRLTILLLALCCAASCGRRHAPATEHPAPALFRPAALPSSLPASERAEYLRTHYWDTFDFADTLFIARADTLHMLDAFASYVALGADSVAMADLVRRASVSRPMLDYFGMLAERVLHDPNSPLRDEERYIPVLRGKLASPWYDALERLGPETELRLALRNRVGEQAGDFRCTLASGATTRLYDLRADYTLLLLTDPECPMCRRTTEELLASPRLNELAERGTLRILTLYSGEDTAAWRRSLSHAPRGWLHACDAACTVRDEGIYDLRALPALYLLDREKRVLVKDSADPAEIEEALDRDA